MIVAAELSPELLIAFDEVVPSSFAFSQGIGKDVPLPPNVPHGKSRTIRPF